ncbi:MAG: hypothetical protein ACFFAY_08745 [Promethearchaeota archaeon]
MDAIVPIGPILFVLFPLFILYLIARIQGDSKTNSAMYYNCRNIAIVIGLVILVYSIFLGLPIHYDPDTPGNYFSYSPLVLFYAWPVTLILLLIVLDLSSLFVGRTNHPEP